VVGLFEPGAPEPGRIWRFASSSERTADDWSATLGPILSETSGAAVSSVVPRITNSIGEYLWRHLRIDPLLVHAGLDLGIRVRTDAPAETGPDRICNAAAAFDRFGGPVIVVDLGTATKIEAVTVDGDFVGGVIAPGLGVMLDALTSKAARLYSVQLKRTKTAIGRNTVHSVQSGIVEGHLAMIEGMVARVREELGGGDHVILTGGFSAVYNETTSVFTDKLPALTLDGLRLIHERNAR
jgi:type III pantothenate kinase